MRECSVCGQPHNSQYETLEGEEWRDVVGYEGVYQISNFGRVKSIPRNGTCLFEKILAPHFLKNGYVQAELHKDNKSKGKKVHRLVAEAFIPNPENKPEINHIDGNKHNNRVENLEWVTSSENQLHAAYVLEKQIVPVIQLTKNQVVVREWRSIAEAGRALNIDAATIVNTCKGNRPSAGGFVWRYKDPDKQKIRKKD